MGKTVLRSSARFAFTDPSPMDTASLNPRYGISAENTNSTNWYVPNSRYLTRKTTR